MSSKGRASVGVGILTNHQGDKPLKTILGWAILIAVAVVAAILIVMRVLGSL